MGCVAGEKNLVLYVYDVRIEGQDHEWVQDALTVRVEMFRSIRLETNLKNTKAMICTPEFIWGEWG